MARGRCAPGPPACRPPAEGLLLLASAGVFLAVAATKRPVPPPPRPRRGDRRQVPARELEHRLGNALATVQSLARQSFPREVVPPELRLAFEGRLMALAAGNRVLARGQWRTTSLHELITAVCALSSDRRPALDGPAVALLPEAGVALAVVLHELAADAARREVGAVAVAWRPTAAGGVELIWREEGGAPGCGAAPMVERLVRHQLHGTLECCARAAGPRCRLVIGAVGIHHGE